MVEVVVVVVWEGRVVVELGGEEQVRVIGGKVGGARMGKGRERGGDILTGEMVS